MTSECIGPKWKFVRYQRQEEQVEEGGTNNNISSSTSHVYNNHHHNPMSNYEVAELTWENGQLAMHGLGVGGVLPTAPITRGTPTSPWCRTGHDNTLESIVHQATTSSDKLLINQNSDKKIAKMSSTAASSSGKWGESSANLQTNRNFARKRTRSESTQGGNKFSKTQEKCVDLSACASASATFSQDNDMTMMTWPSFESPRSSKKNPITTTNDDHPAFCRGSEKGNDDDDEEWKNKEKSIRSHSTRRSRAAAIHNQSERKRRDRINQKMKALQKLVPNASKTDKASMLDEVIEYLKQLQAQVQLMNVVRNMPQMMMMPLGMQQQQHHLLQMSMLARMGMGMGMGMGSNAPPHQFIHPNSAATTTTPNFLTSPFLVPPLIQKHVTSQPNLNQPASNPFNDPYCAFLAQYMKNIEMYNKMAAIYKTTSESSHPSK